MKLNPLSALIAILAATAASGLFAFVLGEAAMSFYPETGEPSEDDLPDLSALAIFVFPMVTAVPNTILVLALGLLGQSHGWARSYFLWIVGGLLCGLALFWTMGPWPGDADPGWLRGSIRRMPEILTGVLCALVARLCIRWRPAEATTP